MDYKGIISRMYGEIVPVPTLFDDNLAVKYDDIRTHVAFLLDQDVKVLYLALSASEFEFMTLEERMKVTETVVDAAQGRALILAQPVGGNWVDEHVAEAKAMVERGADVLVIKPPALKEGQKFFGSKFPRAGYSPQRHDAFFYGYIARFVDEMDTPIVYHDKPFGNGGSVSVELLDRIVNIEQVVGLKEHSEDLNMRRTLYQRFGERVICYDGFSKTTQVLSYFWGARGRHTCWSWFDPAGDRAFRELLERGDMVGAQDMVEAEWPLAYAILQTGFEGYKAVMGLLGLPSGRVRIPGVHINDQDVALLRDALEQVGMTSALRKVG